MNELHAYESVMTHIQVYHITHMTQSNIIQI